MHDEDIALERDDGTRTRLTLRLPGGGTDHPAAAPAVLILPGFKGFKDWGFFPYLAGSLAGAGLATAAVDFSRNGIGERPGEMDRPDLFAHNSLAIEVEESRVALAHLRRDPRVDAGRLALLGHSRGGAVALLAARDEPEIQAVVGWAAVGDWRRRFDPATWETYGRQGWLEVINTRTGQVLRVGRQLLEEMTDAAGRFDPARAAAAIEAPVLLVHGEADEAVPPEEADIIARARAGAGLTTEVVRIPGAGHTFGSVHPFRGTTPELEGAIAATLRFLQSAVR